MSLDKVIKNLFKENPNLTSKQAIAILKKKKDPETDRGWKASNIRNRVNIYLRDRHKNNPPVETRGRGDNVKEPSKTTRADPFKRNDKQKNNNGEKGSIAEVIDLFKIFKDEVDDSFRTLKNDFREEMETVKNDIRKTLPEYVPIEYEDVSLKKTTVESLLAEVENRDELGNHIDEMLVKYKGYLALYKNITEAVKTNKYGVTVFMENDNLCLKPIKKTRIGGLNLKSLLIGAGISGILVFLITYLIFQVLLAQPV